MTNLTYSTSPASKREFLRGLHNVQAEHRGNVVTIGSFDGVHLGHQAILQQVVKQANIVGLPSLAMIFEPQPHEFFSGEEVPVRLMCLSEKIEALFAAGIDRVFCLAFNRVFSELSAEEFVPHILINGLGTRHLVIGDDFRFGYERKGNYAFLKAVSRKYKFKLTDTKTYIINNQRVSSTRIRQILELGHFSDAIALLGKPYTVSGRVVKGQQLGRILGVPTANVHLHGYRSPLAGVFAVRTTLSNGEILPGIANVGVRPTISGDTKPILEVHLFDCNDNLYGESLIVEFKKKIRKEKNFKCVDILRKQMQKDIASARNILHSPQ